MTEIQSHTVTEKGAALSELLTLRNDLHGQLCLQGETGYDEARSIWNAMVDRLPDIVVRCTDTSDIVHAVRFAVEHDLAIAVRAGGHNIAGNAVGDGGLLIDLSPMKTVQVDAMVGRARVAP